MTQNHYIGKWKELIPIAGQTYSGKCIDVKQVANETPWTKNSTSKGHGISTRYFMLLDGTGELVYFHGVKSFNEDMKGMQPPAHIFFRYDGLVPLGGTDAEGRPWMRHLMEGAYQNLGTGEGTNVDKK